MIKIIGKLSMAFLLVGTIMLGMAGLSHSALIAEWNYNTQSSAVSVDNADGIPTQSLVGSAVGSFFTEAYYANKVNYQGSGLSWAVSTQGYKDISITLDFQRTVDNRNPTSFIWYYSINGGTNWFQAGDAVQITGIDSNTLQLNLASIDQVENASEFQLKFVSNQTLANTNASYDNAKIKFDNVKFSGTVVPIPAAAWMLGTGLAGLAFIKRRRK